MSDHADETRICLNCGAPIRGQYCGACGQRATTRLISLWELVRDAFGDLFELDSRLWRTLVPLLVRPGLLTREYLQGRRARYMPPFRMYLVLSLLFFVVAFFDPHQQLAIFYEPAEPAPELSEEDQAARNDEAQQVLEELVAEGVLDESVLDEKGLPQRDAPAPEENDAEQSSSNGLSLTFNDNETFCVLGDGSLDSTPEFIQRRFSKERLEQVCERVRAAGATGVIKALLDNVPVGLLILLPIMALVLKILYPLSRRYYVEHLLFFVHFHAFLFVLLTLQVLWTRLISLVGLPGFIGVLPVVATSFYVPVYLYQSMRRVYGQSRFLTFLKFLSLSVTYVIMLAVMIVAALLFAVFSI